MAIGVHKRNPLSPPLYRWLNNNTVVLDEASELCMVSVDIRLRVFKCRSYTGYILSELIRDTMYNLTAFTTMSGGTSPGGDKLPLLLLRNI